MACLDALEKDIVSVQFTHHCRIQLLAVRICILLSNIFCGGSAKVVSDQFIVYRHPSNGSARDPGTASAGVGRVVVVLRTESVNLMGLSDHWIGWWIDFSLRHDGDVLWV